MRAAHGLSRIQAVRVRSVLLCAALAACGPAPGPIDYSGPTAEWTDWGAAKGGGRYSPLDQITRENVGALRVAWTYHTGHLRGDDKYVVFQNSPLVVDGTLYVCTPYNQVIALDPETGAERWKFDAQIAADDAYVINCRGVSTWLDPRSPEDATCRRRVVMGTVDARLIEIDARTGQRCSEFGTNGEIDLRPGLGDVKKGDYGVTSPPLVVGDRIVTGAMVIDDTRVDIAGGVVRAFDVRSGKLLWGWDPVPPDRPPLPPGPDGKPHYERGTSNAWSALSADAERGLVFVPTGNTSPDYYGGQRKGLDYYSSSVVALDAETGRVRWHFQAVHHDLWDYDSPAQPTLFEFPGPAASVPALALPTKMGHLFLLNRVTGEPLFPVEERPVPQDGAVEGEYLSPTQPFPTRPPPLHPSKLTPDDAWGFTFWDRGKCREKIACAALRGDLHAAVDAGVAPLPRHGGRHELGQRRGRSAAPPARRQRDAHATTSASSRARSSASSSPATGSAPPYEPQNGTPYGLYAFRCSRPRVRRAIRRRGETLAASTAGGIVRWDVPCSAPRAGSHPGRSGWTTARRTSAARR